MERLSGSLHFILMIWPFRNGIWIGTWYKNFMDPFRRRLSCCSVAFLTLFILPQLLILVFFVTSLHIYFNFWAVLFFVNFKKSLG